MNKKRENNSSINLTASQGIPKVSFAADVAAGVQLIPEQFNISGNVLLAYYDSAHRLVFVLDKTTDDQKPNVLLVINSDGDRKWDDILANDYNLDLETVRPKLDNKYQKLDIEYTGLPVYNNLINEYNAGADLSGALNALNEFRTATIQMAVKSRLDSANETIVNATETIAKTGETIHELQARLKKLREKLARQKKEVGKEPTKQSAAKILKTESQIDATNEKLNRAKRRLLNAKRRLTVAEEDVEQAHNILNQKKYVASVPVVQTKKEILMYKEDTKEPKAEDMAEEKVKPLFDKDPEILDEKIAFKPIDFNMPSIPTVQPEIPVEQPAVIREEIITPVAVPLREDLASEEEEIIAPAPLMFTPPIMKDKDTVITEELNSSVAVDVPEIAPVLDTIRSVLPSQQTPDKPVQPEPAIAEPVPAAPVIGPAPISSGDRPISPISGPVIPAPVRSKPTALYYIMLVALISLSILTLWLYQRNTANNVPDLTATAKTEVMAPVSEPAPTPVQPGIANNPFIQVEPSLETEPAPVVVPSPVAEPQPVVEQPMPLAPQPMPEMDIVDDEEIYEEVSVGPASAQVSIAEPVYQAADIIETTPAVAVQPQQVEKPAYNVSQQDNMFIAAPDYESEDVYYDDMGYVPQEDIIYDDQVNEYYE